MQQCDNRRHAGRKAADLAEAQRDVHEQNHKRNHHADEALLEEARAHRRVHRAGFHNGKGAIRLRDLLLLLQRNGLVARKGHRDLIALLTEALVCRNGNITARGLLHQRRDLVGIDVAVH